jgi:hypothetical protein
MKSLVNLSFLVFLLTEGLSTSLLVEFIRTIIGPVPKEAS